MKLIDPRKFIVTFRGLNIGPLSAFSKPDQILFMMAAETPHLWEAQATARLLEIGDMPNPSISCE